MTKYFLSPSMGLSYRDVSNDNLKSWRTRQRKTEPDQGSVLLTSSTGYWLREGDRWVLPSEDASIAVFPGDSRDGVADLVIGMACAAGKVDIDVPLRYLPDRCSKPSRMFRRVARR